MFLIDQRGTRIRPICPECLGFHKLENCKKRKMRRRRERRREDKWLRDLLALQSAMEAQRAAQQA
jgi:hypothetical protein